MDGAWTSRRRLVLWSGTVGSVVLLAAAASVAEAQGSSRDSTAPVYERVYRVRARQLADSSYMSALRRARAQLRVRLDSLQRELEDMSVESPDRVPRFREITALLSSLANLSDLEDAARPNAASMRTLRSRGEAPMPRSMTFARPFVSDAMLLPGWIGINIEAPHQQMVRGDTAYFRYFSYPEIVSVEPDSPAERAGISRGDRLVAYDGDDVRDREINMTRLLQPSRRITVTVRRDGEEREFPLTVVRPPPRLMTRRLLTMPDEPGRAPAAPMILMAPNGARRMRAPIAVKVVTGDGSTPIAGASLSEIRDEELGRIFGVNSGLLVTEVFSDPAQASGLRGGDVIVGADGRDITRLAQLRAIIVSHNDDRAVDLEVVRQKRTRTITLRW